jgi:hypothetical protein
MSRWLQQQQRQAKKGGFHCTVLNIILFQQSFLFYIFLNTNNLVFREDSGLGPVNLPTEEEISSAAITSSKPAGKPISGAGKPVFGAGKPSTGNSNKPKPGK